MLQYIEHARTSECYIPESFHLHYGHLKVAKIFDVSINKSRGYIFSKAFNTIVSLNYRHLLSLEC
jgi:hypothetical protein